jgi:hypothetical protein
VRVSRPAGDTGEAGREVSQSLAAYAEGTGSEHAALTALAATRLLVPVVAVLAAASEDGAEKESEMALPTLIGNDGRRAVIAFTGTETLRRWKADARPVPVPASRVWAAAISEADAVAIDVAGPVPLVIEGARLDALANGEPPPLPHEDPDIRAEVAAVTPDFTLGPGGASADLTVTLATPDMGQARQIALRLSSRLRRGIEIRALLSRTEAPDSPPPLPPHDLASTQALRSPGCGDTVPARPPETRLRVNPGAWSAGVCPAEIRKRRRGKTFHRGCRKVAGIADMASRGSRPAGSLVTRVDAAGRGSSRERGVSRGGGATRTFGIIERTPERTGGLDNPPSGLTVG